MKTKPLYALLLALVTIFTISCSKDDYCLSNNESKLKKPKKITGYQSGNQVWTYNYEYNGHLLTKIHGSDDLIYTLNYDSNDKLQSIACNYLDTEYTVTATYANGKLDQLYYSPNSEGIDRLHKFYYNTENEVFKSEVFENTSLVETHLYTYDAIGNVIKDELNGVEKIMTYDTKNHPLKNIITQIEINFLGNSWLGNLVNNYTSYGEFTYINEYDDDDFLIRRTTKNLSGTTVQIDVFEY